MVGEAVSPIDYLYYLLLTGMLFDTRKSSVFLTSLMVVEHNLSIMRRMHLSSCYILVLLNIRVYIYYFSIPLISKQKTGLAASRVYFKVRTVVGGTYACLPVVVTEVSRFGDQFRFSLKNGSKIFCFEPVSIVDITRDLLFFAWDLNPEKDDSEPSSIEYFFLSFG